MSNNNLSLLSLLFLSTLASVALAQRGQQSEYYQGQNQCQIQRIQALQPNRRIESEGGVTELWLQNDSRQELQCAGVAVVRQTIRRNSYLLPGYNNAPKLTYVVQGQGIHSVVAPGCPETYQQHQQPYKRQGEGKDVYSDEHQKVRRVSQGDIVASPTGLVHWFYNDGENPLVLVSLIDIRSDRNQLDDQLRKFYIGGNPQRGGEQEQQEEQSYRGTSERGQSRYEANNIFNGFDDQILQEVLGVSRDTIEKIKGRSDSRGHMVQSRPGLQLVRPSRMEEEEEERRENQGSTENGLEETVCTARLRENIGNPSRADIYNPQAGYISTVNSLNLPILNLLHLSAERGVLHRNAIYAPHWNLNAHSIIYVTRGSARLQIVGNYRNTVYDGQLSEGQVLVVPQNFAVTKQAGDRGFEWVSFKTNQAAMTHSLAGKTSAFRGLPVDMLASMYQISRQEAENLKYNRGREVMIFAPSSSSYQGRASA